MPKVDNYGSTMQFRPWEGQLDRYVALKEAGKLKATNVNDRLRETFERLLLEAESGTRQARPSVGRPPRWYARRALTSLQLTMADWAPRTMIEARDYGTTAAHREAMAAAVASFGGVPHTYSALFGPSSLPFMPATPEHAIMLAQARRERAGAEEKFLTAFSDAIDGCADPGRPPSWLLHPGHDPVSLETAEQGKQWGRTHADEFGAVVEAVIDAGFVGDVFDPRSEAGARCMLWLQARVMLAGEGWPVMLEILQSRPDDAGTE